MKRSAPAFVLAFCLSFSGAQAAETIPAPAVQEQKIVLELSVPEANALAQLLDAGLRSVGIGQAEMAAILFKKLNAAANAQPGD